MGDDIVRCIFNVDPFSTTKITNVKNLVANVAHCYGNFVSDGHSDNDRDEALANCQANGIQILPYCTYRASSFLGLLDAERIRIITKYSSHPSIFGWQLFEEPGNTVDWGIYTATQVKAYVQARYDQVKPLVGDKPLCITINLNQACQDPFDAMDIAMPACYPCTPSKTDEETVESLEFYWGSDGIRGEWMQDLIDDGKGLIPVIQAFIREGESQSYMEGKIALQYNWWKSEFGSPHISYYKYSYIVAHSVLYDGVEALNEELSSTPPTYYSESARDGDIRENGDMNIYATTMRVKIYPGYTHHGFVSFDTSNIPNNAVIDSAYLRVYVDHFDKDKGGTINVNYLLYDTLDVGDYDAVPQAANIATISPGVLDGVWVNSSNFTQVNISGRSQYRLQYDIGYDISVLLGTGESSHVPELYVAWHLDLPPIAPTSLLCEGTTNPTCVNDLTPEFSAAYNDPDEEDIANAIWIQVATTEGGFDTPDMWDSGWISVSISEGYRCPDKSYAGTALSLDGSLYYWRCRYRDDDNKVGAWSAINTFKMASPPSAPTSLECEETTNPVGVTDLTPEFSAIFNDPEAGDKSVLVEIHVATVEDWIANPDMWNSGWISVAEVVAGNRCALKSYAGSPLSLNEATYYWGIRFKDDGGSEGAWSATGNFTMAAESNNPPSAPTALLCEGETNPVDVADLTPEFSAEYNDPDAGDKANAVQIVVATTEDGLYAPDMWNSGWITLDPLLDEGDRCPDVSYAGIALSADGSKYYWRIRFRDDENAVGAWSAVANFTMLPSGNVAPSAPSSLECEGATNPTDVTDLTPEFTAIFNDPNTGDKASAVQICVATTEEGLDDPDMWDSGWIDISGEDLVEGERCAEQSYNGGVLSLDGTKYYWKIRFKDDDGAVGAWS